LIVIVVSDAMMPRCHVIASAAPDCDNEERHSRHLRVGMVSRRGVRCAAKGIGFLSSPSMHLSRPSCRPSASTPAATPICPSRSN
jgi:hypothetical protein